MTLIRIIVSLLTAAMVGGLLVALDYLLGQLVVNGPEQMVQYGLRTAMRVFLISSALWLAGMLGLGSPLWFLMHKAGKTTALHAAILGFVLTFVFSFVFSTFFARWMIGDGSDGSRFSASDSGGPTWVDNQLTLHGWVSAAENALFFSLAGVLVALSLWWFAYRVRS